MNTLARDFVEGGFAMYPIALLGCLGTFGGVTGFVLALVIGKARTLWFAAGLMGLGVLAPLLGTVGYVLGQQALENALAQVSPEDAELIQMAGTAEALTCLQYGVGAGLLPFCLGVALVGLGLVRRDPATA